MIAYVLDGVFLAAEQLHSSQNVIHGNNIRCLLTMYV